MKYFIYHHRVSHVKSVYFFRHNCHTCNIIVIILFFQMEMMCILKRIICLIMFKLNKVLFINYGERGATKWEKSRFRNFLRPPSSRQGKLFAHPLLKSGNFLHPHFNMAKTSSYCVKTTPTTFCAPLQHS